MEEQCVCSNVLHTLHELCARVNRADGGKRCFSVSASGSWASSLMCFCCSLPLLCLPQLMVVAINIHHGPSGGCQKRLAQISEHASSLCPKYPQISTQALFLATCGASGTRTASTETPAFKQNTVYKVPRNADGAAWYQAKSALAGGSLDPGAPAA